MLVLTRRLNESILIGDGIEIKIVQVRGAGDQAVVRLGITAPREVTVLRKEVFDEVVAANRDSARAQVAIPPGLLPPADPGRSTSHSNVGILKGKGSAPAAEEGVPQNDSDTLHSDGGPSESEGDTPESDGGNPL